MKLLIFSETDVWGGLETHAVTLSEGLAAEGHDAVVVCLGDRTYELYRRASPHGVTLMALAPPARRTVWNWLWLLRHLSADAAVLEKGTLWTGGLALELALRLRYQRYVAIQHLEPPDLPPRSSRRHVGGLVPGIGLWWYRWRWSGYARSLAPVVTVCVSDAISRRLSSAYGFSARKLVTVHNTVDCSKFGTDSEAGRRARAAWGVPEDATVFGSLGRLSPQKGLDVAIDAFGRTVSEHPGLSLYLVLVGEGPERAALLERARSLGLQDRVVLPGFMSTPREAYPGFDVFLIPSRFEGLPFALIEAMAAGIEVIGTKVGGVPEVVTDESMGTLVAPEDPAALSRAMCEVLSREPAARAAVRRAARQRTLDAFDSRVEGRKIARLLRRTDEGHGLAGTQPEAPPRQGES